MLDMPASIRQALASEPSSGAQAAGTTAFRALTCDLSLTQSRLDLTALVFDSPALKFTGKGTIGFDRVMHFDLSATAGGYAERPIVLEGTLDRPQIRPGPAPNRAR